MFDRDVAEAIAARLVRVLGQVAGDPLVLVAGVEVLDAAERSLVVERWNATGRAVRAGTLPELFAGQAARCPGAVAVAEGDRCWSYAELAAVSGRVAGVLAGRGGGAGVTGWRW